jgi:hypothetical protein
MGGQNDQYRAGRAPKAPKAAASPRGKGDNNTDYSYGQGPRGGSAFEFGGNASRSPSANPAAQSALNDAHRSGRDPHGDGGHGAMPQLRGQAKEDHRRQENRVNQEMHSSGSGIPQHEYEPTPPAGRVP